MEEVGAADEDGFSCDAVEPVACLEVAQSDKQAQANKDPISRAMDEWVANLNPKLRLELLRGLEKYRGMSQPISFGSLFAGSDGLSRLMPKIASKLSSIAGFEITCGVSYQAENDPLKQKWLMEQFPEVRHLFSDVASLSQPKALCLKTGVYVRVPYVQGIIAGFSCKSVSKNNRNSHLNIGCVKAGTQETGETFQYTKDTIVAKKPIVVLLENVTELASGDEDSDAQWVVDTLRGMGYVARVIRVQAQDFGSLPRRDRLYFVGMRSEDVSLVDFVFTLSQDPV